MKVFDSDFRSGRFWITLVFAVIVIAAVLSFLGWEWIRSGSEVQTESLDTGVITTKTTTVESVSTTLRNVGLITGGIVAVLLAMWRSLVAERQANAALHQSEVALTQAQTAERQSRTTLQNFLNDRYQQGVRKLESDSLSVRLDGIDTLRRLAGEHPEQYHVQAMSRLCTFLSIPDKLSRSRIEVNAAMTVIGSRSKEDISRENNEHFELSLIGANLQGAALNRLDLSESNLMSADLSNASLWEVDLSNSRLQMANLKGAWLDGANLSGVQFCLAEGEYSATGLTQAQLDSASSYQHDLPRLSGVLDAETEKQLVSPTREPGWLEQLNELVRTTTQPSAPE